MITFSLPVLLSFILFWLIVGFMPGLYIGYQAAKRIRIFRIKKKSETGEHIIVMEAGDKIKK